MKYSPNAAVIDIRVSATAEALQIDITDAGQGLPDLPVAELFKKFVRGNGEGAVAGSGLGLAIAKWIIEAHHGRIALQARHDGHSGTVAHISLPIEPV